MLKLRSIGLSDYSEFAGHSANATAKALNERRLPSPRGGKWTARSIINIRGSCQYRTAPKLVGRWQARRDLAEGPRLRRNCRNR
jgi:Recombinase